MAEIGNYIHYNYSNYRKFGIAKKISGYKYSTENRTASFTDMLGDITNRYYNSGQGDLSRCAELERMLNYFCKRD